MTNQEKFFERAKYYVDNKLDASPRDKAPAHLACAESVNQIYEDVFGEPICKVNPLSTYYLRRDLKEGVKFRKTDTLKAGTIIISPTGYGGKNGVKYGHVGIAYDDSNIMSNNSSNGKFEINYTLDKWKKYYVEKGGYELLMFDII